MIRTSKGFSLVELMVGLTIGIIGLLIISQVLDVFNTQRKTTAAGSDAQTTGAIAAYMVERDVRMSGYGIAGLLLGCTIRGWDELRGADFTLTFDPIAITVGSGGAPDSITVTYGSSDTGLLPATLTHDYNGHPAVYQVDNRFGFHEGNLIVGAEPGKDCSLGQVTGVPGAGSSDNVIHNSGQYTNVYGDNVPARYNKAGGMGIDYSAGTGKVYNIGDLPVNKRYSVDTTNNQLLLTDDFSGTVDLPIAEHVTFLRAMYGKDTNADGTVDTYDTTKPTTPAGWAQVIVLRFAVVARSPKREPELVSGATLQLWPDITLPSGTTLTGPSLSLSEEQRHYRYKVFDTLVPLRNKIWTLPDA